MYDFITIGDAMKDTFIFPSLEEIPKPVDGSRIFSHPDSEKYLVFALGDKISITDTFSDFGGTAANVAVGLQRLKIKTAIISAIGHDEIGEEIKERLKKEKIDVDLIKTYLARKSSFSIIISYKGERTILVRQSFEPNDLNIGQNPDTKWLYVGPLGGDYHKLYSKVTALAAQKNIKIALNPGSIQIHEGLRGFGALLSVAEIIFLNREEAQKLTGLTGITTMKELAISIKKTGVAKVIITDGQEGAYACFDDEFLKIGPYPARRVEATGAGDAFAAGFLAAYFKGETIFTCLKWGVVNSASVVSKYGAQQGLLTERAIETRIKEYRWPAESLRFS